MRAEHAVLNDCPDIYERNMREPPTDPTVLEALEWFVRMRDEKVSDADRRAFQAWLNESEANAAAWEGAEALWKRFDIVQPEIERMRRSQSYLNRRTVLVGSLVALTGAAGAYGVNRRDLFADYVTDVGERRTFKLLDGSMVELGSYSALSANFTEGSRQLLLYRGQAFFEVAANTASPFIVNVAGGATQALGTRFDLKYVDDQVTVTVSEHAVSVRMGGSPALTVKQGWQVTYGSGGGLGQVTQVDLASAEAWRRDRIVFQDVPLRRVLVELERYRRGRIVLTDKSLGDTPVTAIFDARQVDSALQTIAATLPIRFLHATRYMTIVYPAS